MSYCRNCGSELIEGKKFCADCGAEVVHSVRREQYCSNDEINIRDSYGEKIPNTASVSGGDATNIRSRQEHRHGTNGEKKNSNTHRRKGRRKRKVSKLDRFSRFFGILLLILAFVDYYSDPPVLTILLSVTVIAAGTFCLYKKYKLKGFTIAAIILAVYCLSCGIKQGSRLGFFVTPDYSNVQTNSSSDVTAGNTKKETEPTSSSTSTQTSSSTSTQTSSSTPAPASSSTPEQDSSSNPAPASSSTPAQTSTGVDPELKAFLDSYEDFMDEYVQFMKNYSNNPGDALGMMSNYTRILARYEEFSKQLEKYDSNSMSTEDAKYYLEVVNRCNQKLLDIY